MRSLALGSDTSPLGFTRTGSTNMPEWDRFLTLDGKAAFHLGNVCNTCEFFFERLGGANRSLTAGELGTTLAAGVPPMDANWISTVGAILPLGDYVPFYCAPIPALVRPGEPGDYFCEEHVATWGVNSFWGLPHSPHSEYYRGRRMTLEPARFGNRGLFEFIVPMFPHGWLNDEEIDSYRTSETSEPPTALAISDLDVKGPADWNEQPPFAEHACLVHYLLDGHHKTYAAALENRPIGLLSFLAVDQSVAKREEVWEAAGRLAERFIG